VVDGAGEQGDAGGRVGASQAGAFQGRERTPATPRTRRATASTAGLYPVATEGYPPGRWSPGVRCDGQADCGTRDRTLRAAAVRP